MNETQGIRFSKLVSEKLTSKEQARLLWIPIAEEFDRSGPDDAKAYLDVERQRLEERLQNLLDQFEGR